MGDELDRLYERIQGRCRAVSEEAPGWPCTKGCDECCRRLAEPPRATGAEWEKLLAAFARLSPEVQATLRERVAEMARLAAQPVPPRNYLCPMLDRESGECLVYEGRLSACRTFGFYASREKGAWCERVRLLAEERQVLLGNEDALEVELARLGPPEGIAEAFGVPTPDAE
ncbi:MAG TPA: YkgJ family cysteine cluster protein [Myxococcales bacterium]|jgi:Fe-S-cluster containining protein